MTSGGTPAAERLLAALGLILLLGIVGTLLYEALTQPDDPLPRIELALERAVPIGDSWVALVAVRNSGEAGAVDVTLAGELTDGAGEPEIRETSLAELPPLAVRRIGFHFDGEPRADALRLRVIGFTLP